MGRRLLRLSYEVSGDNEGLYVETEEGTVCFAGVTVNSRSHPWGRLALLRPTELPPLDARAEDLGVVRALALFEDIESEIERGARLTLDGRERLWIEHVIQDFVDFTLSIDRPKYFPPVEVGRDPVLAFRVSRAYPAD